MVAAGVDEHHRAPSTGYPKFFDIIARTPQKTKIAPQAPSQQRGQEGSRG